MHRTTISVIALSAFCFAYGATAATIKNLDRTAHKVTIVQGDARQEYVLNSQQEVATICVSSCTLYMGDDPDPYDIVGADQLEIEQGQIYYKENVPQSQGN